MVCSIRLKSNSNMKTKLLSLFLILTSVAFAQTAMNLVKVGSTTVAAGQSAAAASVPVTLSNENVQDLTFIGQSAQTATINNIIPVVASANASNLTGYRSGSVQIVSTGTGGTYIFEGSNDNVNFQTVPVYSQLILTGTPIVAAITATSSQLIYTFPISFQYFRLRIATTITGGSIQAFSIFKQASWSPAVVQVAQSNGSSLNTAISGSIIAISSSVSPGTAAGNLGKAEDNVAASSDTGVAVWGVRQDAATIPASASGDYSQFSLSKHGATLITPLGNIAKTFRGVVNVASAVTATDIAILPGNATNTVYVTKVTISGIQTTAGLVDLLLVKRSAANTGGTSAAITSVPMDASDAAAVSLPLSYTANPTPGAAVGSIDRAYINAAPLATGVVPVTREFNFGAIGKPVILSGVAQGLAVNLNGVTVTGGTFTIVFEWMELP